MRILRLCSSKLKLWFKIIIIIFFVVDLAWAHWKLLFPHLAVICLPTVWWFLSLYFFLPLAGDSIDRENKYDKNNLWISNMHQTQKPHPRIQKKSTLRKMSHVWSAAVAVEGDYNNSIRNIYIWVYSIYIYSGCSLCKFGLKNNNDNTMLWYNVIIPLQHARRHRHTLSYNRITNGRFRLQV